jgi:hypothetical protein
MSYASRPTVPTVLPAVSDNSSQNTNRRLRLDAETSSKITDAAFPYFASVMLPDCAYAELEVCSKWMIWVSKDGEGEVDVRA